MTDVMAEVKNDAQLIADIWDNDGPVAAKVEFERTCKKWRLTRWQAITLCDLVARSREDYK